MGIEDGDVILAVDPASSEDPVIAIDPIELTPIAIAEPLPAELISDVSTDLPPDARDFGGLVDGGVDFPSDGTTDDASGADGSGDDGAVFITVGISGDTTEDGTVYTIDDTGTIIDRPVDPEPNWRTPGTESGSSDGIDTGGIITLDDPVVIAIGDDSFAVLDKSNDATTDDDTDGDRVAPVMYTLGACDPVIMANAAELTHAARGDEPAEAQGNPTPVHYAASEPFHTGLDLL